MSQRVGPVVYPAPSMPGRDWDELTSLTTELGFKAVKTWLGAHHAGEAMAKVQTPPYRRLIAEFPIVHLNVSLGYITNGEKDGKMDPQAFKEAMQEWRDVTLYLCRESRMPNQVFLLSVGGELNVYLGTKATIPDFPVAEYVNTCHATVTQALATIKGPRPQVFTLAEVQGEAEFESFAARWVPEFQTDLVSLSHYTFFRDTHDSLEIIRRHLKAVGPFGKDRLMLGEFGPTLERCNWNQAVRTLRPDARMLGHHSLESVRWLASAF